MDPQWTLVLGTNGSTSMLNLDTRVGHPASTTWLVTPLDMSGAGYVRSSLIKHHEVCSRHYKEQYCA